MASAEINPLAEPIMIKLAEGDFSNEYERFETARREIRKSLDGGVREVNLNLLGMNHISSELFNFLLLSDMDCRRNGASLKVLDVSPDLIKIFRFAGMNQLIDFESFV